MISEMILSMISYMKIPVSPPPAAPPPSPPSSSPSDTCIFGGRAGVAAPAPLAPPGVKGAVGGRCRIVVSPAPEPCLGLAGQVSLEHHVAGLVEHLKPEGYCFLLEVDQVACKIS